MDKLQFDFTKKFNSEEDAKNLNDYLKGFKNNLDNALTQIKSQKQQDAVQKYGENRICEVCSSKFLSEEDKIYHIERIHPVFAFQKGHLDFLCEICYRKGYKLFNNYSKHVIKCNKAFQKLNAEELSSLLIAQQFKHKKQPNQPNQEQK